MPPFRRWKKRNKPVWIRFNMKDPYPLPKGKKLVGGKYIPIRFDQFFTIRDPKSSIQKTKFKFRVRPRRSMPTVEPYLPQMWAPLTLYKDPSLSYLRSGPQKSPIYHNIRLHWALQVEKKVYAPFPRISRSDPWQGRRPLHPSERKVYSSMLRRPYKPRFSIILAKGPLPYKSIRPPFLEESEDVLRTLRVRLIPLKKWKRPFPYRYPKTRQHRFLLAGRPKFHRYKKHKFPLTITRGGKSVGHTHTTRRTFPTHLLDSYRFHNSDDDLLEQVLDYSIKYIAGPPQSSRYFRTMLKLQNVGRFSVLNWRSKNTKRKRYRRSTGGGSNFWVRRVYRPHARGFQFHRTNLAPIRGRPQRVRRRMSFY